MMCPACATEAGPEARFCSRCGRTLIPAGAGPGGGAGADSATADSATAGELDLSRPTGVSLLAALAVALGLGLLLAGVGFYFFAQRSASDVPKGAAPAVLAILLALGLLHLVTAAGLWRMRSWGRWLQVGLACLGLLAFPLGTMVCALILWYLLRPGMSVLFSDPAEDRITPAQRRAVLALGKSQGAVVLLAAGVGALMLVAWVGIIAAIAIPNLLNAIQRGKQKRTMMDLRSIGAAIESYRVDFGMIPAVDSGADAAVALAASLEPTYINSMPRFDAWKTPFSWHYVPAGSADPVDASVSPEEPAEAGAEAPQERSYAVISFGRDKQPDGDVPTGATTDFRRDMYYSDGAFLQYPEGGQN